MFPAHRHHWGVDEEKDIKRATRKQYSSAEKTRIVHGDHRGEGSITACAAHTSTQSHPDNATVPACDVEGSRPHEGPVVGLSRLTVGMLYGSPTPG